MACRDRTRRRVLVTIPSRRTAGDTWAITEKRWRHRVGVAAARAVETAATNPLIVASSPKKLLKLSSAGTAGRGWPTPIWLAWLDGDQLGRRVHQVACDTRRCAPTSSTEASRCRRDAVSGEVVILAAGLDARATCLSLARSAVLPESCSLHCWSTKAGFFNRMARFQRRDGMPSRTCATTGRRADSTGFDGTWPTAWLAEGLPYLRRRRGPPTWSPRSAHRAARSLSGFSHEHKGNAALESRMRERLGLDIDVQALTYGVTGRMPAQWLARSVAQREQSRGDGPTGPGVPQDLVDETVRTTFAARASGHTRSTKRDRHPQ